MVAGGEQRRSGRAPPVAAEVRLDTDGVGEAAARARRRDGLLVQRCRSGDESAWTALVERFSHYVYAILTRGYRLDQTTAEDIFQEVFIRTYRSLGTLDQPEAIKPWIAQLTRRAAFDRLRATRPHVDIDAVQEPGASDPEFELVEQAATVQRALAQLPEPYRDVVERFFLRDQSYRTIADELGLAPGTIASRISRGLSMLRELFEQSGEITVGPAS
jgi:RNA polymerase sigma-70 factor, ECF subfamily